MTPAYDCYIGILPDSNFATIQSDSITCPLGQLVIASYAREKIPGLEAVVYNGLRTSKTEIFERIEGAVSDRKMIWVQMFLLVELKQQCVNTIF
jgi:hypothetical protein